MSDLVQDSTPLSTPVSALSDSAAVEVAADTAPVKVKSNRGRKREATSKSGIAREIFARLTAAGAERSAILDELESTLGVTRKVATTYFYVAQK